MCDRVDGCSKMLANIDIEDNRTSSAMLMFFVELMMLMMKFLTIQNN